MQHDNKTDHHTYINHEVICNQITMQMKHDTNKKTQRTMQQILHQKQAQDSNRNQKKQKVEKQG